MSKFVKVKTQLRDVDMIKRALDDLGLHYVSDSSYRHLWSGATHSVPILVTSGHARFGLRPTEDGTFEIVGDDMQLRRIQPEVDAVTQRYAYHMVLAETSKAGFELVEDTVAQDGVIRLTVRRWT